MRTRTLFPTLVCLALAIMVGGCSDSTGSSTPEQGTYILREINTLRIPVSFSEGNSSIQINSGTITLTPDRTWSETLVVEFPRAR